MRVQVNIPADLLERIDDKAKSLYISRSSYITLTMSEKLNNEKLMEALPEMLDIAKREIAEEEAKKILDEGGEN